MSNYSSTVDTLAHRVKVIAFRAVAAIALALAFATAPAAAFAVDAAGAGDQGSPCVPTQEQVESYRADGSLDERAQVAERLGHAQLSADLTQQALARQAAALGQGADVFSLRSVVPSTWKSGMATVGAGHVLALRVSFPDYSFADDDTLEALDVLINGGGSGTYQAACLAKSMFEEEQGEGKMTIEVIDSKTYTYIYGHIVVKAAEMREQGESFDAIVSVVKSRLNRVEAYLGVYSLKFLKKSGRISGGAAFVGEALGLKPISHVYDGAVKVCDKVRGEKALVAGMSKKVSARVVQPDKQTAILLYGDVPAERLDEMEKRLRTEIGFRDVERVVIGPSVLTNTGPLAMAVAYYGTPRD